MTKTVEIKNLTMYFEHTQTKAIDNLFGRCYILINLNILRSTSYVEQKTKGEGKR